MHINQEAIKHNKHKKLFDTRGSITMEAAIILPVFFCVVVAIAFLLRAVQVQERIQHAISQAALEIAGASYIYGISGALDIQRDAESLAMRGMDNVKDTIVKSAQFDNWLPGNISGEAEIQFDNASGFMIDSVNGALFSKYAEFVTKKYLGAAAAADGVSADAASRGAQSDVVGGLNIRGGGDGLDFAGSTYLTNGREDVTICVNYEFTIPIPIKPLSRLKISQEAHARAWLFGAGSNAIPEDPYEDEEDIWALSNFERGLKIRAIFHANLPDRFPTIASFSGGVATAIHSLDTTAESYRTPFGIGRQIDGYIREIRDYNGRERPYGRDGITVPSEAIMAKRLVLVIPRNDITPGISDEIDRCIRDALAQGVVLQVERYATKHIDSEKDGE